MRSARRTVGLITAVALALGACSSGAGGAEDRLVLAETQPLGGFNPLMGYGELGVSPLYEGLYRPDAASDGQVPDLLPALATAAPQRIGPRTWRIPLRAGVTFSDGTPFDAADVVATYRAARDPKVAADIATHVAPVQDVTPDGGGAVIVRLATDGDPTPYLLLGIVPAERIEERPVAQWGLNRTPVGTGPYRLDSLADDQAVLVARSDRGPQPAVRRVVYTLVPDDNARAQRVRAGEVDGALLPPKLAASLDGRDGVRTMTVKSADWRGVSLPAANAFTADPVARRAMNLGVDRAAVISGVLAGAGEPASTPYSSVYGAAYEPGAQFDFDAAEASRLLDEAGWLPGPDGVRTRNGSTAAFGLLYNAQDTVRRDLAVAFAAAMKPLGIAVTPQGSSWDEIEKRTRDAAILLGGGETPFSIDAQGYDALHTRVPGSSPYSNPGDFTAPGLDDLLERARNLTPGPEKDAAYRQVQRIYAAQPSAVYLAHLHHAYAVRAGGWTYAPPILEPHSHGVTWGPWWNLPSWKR
ncbi:Extracellular solute-binding protein family 5 OS=Tsukamurella paurometabola (strain ATCC 8368 / DSM / CCUG 35730 / CIP 100753 / JCM 10117 / KCTC 9821 /NBRC 16120 / NCIMB 702349 / NCTC 13040) OX=521096 GN=Tpau_1971 PE=3 SV=1 [Tsukamurella paurometabola]|uniref:Extracellular solute-binding protein family 5 n=1 Tax=Tsukamurella paurometabola (strain ATCC 8368 / DSM 20162 / CCUG 35730 / CIP 100753 / JCM 10117 / KCTC 9821 / NBRC 16120 / NCIMB 702349 / NCTC 13040) TaxID=521096 RepID=D5UNL5_TSUPD|nr:ABC transporter substrate-binding protein [Tsukamurella paurometabola]ADG78583.1 extracellular solute-binding protein family 5 [Tsukamurella paurometabola DSM 20162]SUP32292.1 Oligopeptide-binding protein AppA precursor [Tsukamurella paurometabola]